MKTSASSTLRWVDLIRVLGSFFVVLAHVSYRDGETSLYYVLSRTAVPLFFMVSGYLLLGREEPYTVFFEKRIVKVFVPFLIWSLVYLLWNREGFESGFSPKLVISYALKIIHGPRESHLWFFYHLLGLYIFTPILRVFAARASLRDLYYFCGLWFLVVPVLSFFEVFTPLRNGFEVYFIGGYVGYFMLGHLLGKIQIDRRQLVWTLFLFTALSIGTALLNTSFNNEYFVDYLGLNVVLMSVFAYILLREMRISDRLYRFLAPFSRASFGIYLVHMIVLDLLARIPLVHGWLSMGSAVYMLPFLGLIGYLSSYFVVAILQRIPILRWSVP